MWLNKTISDDYVPLIKMMEVAVIEEMSAWDTNSQVALEKNSKWFPAQV